MAHCRGCGVLCFGRSLEKRRLRNDNTNDPFFLHKESLRPVPNTTLATLQCCVQQPVLNGPPHTHQRALHHAAQLHPSGRTRCTAFDSRLVAPSAVTNSHKSDKTCAHSRARRHHPMPALSPRAMPWPKRLRSEPRHHACIAHGRAGRPRARSPCSSTCARASTTRKALCALRSLNQATGTPADTIGALSDVP